MTEAGIRRLLVSLVRQAGATQRFSIGVRRVDATGQVPHVAALDRGFRVSERRRREFLAGRAAAAEALARRDMQGYSVSRTERGVPVWPPGVVGSISHSRTWAVSVVFDSDIAICCGVDIEEVTAASAAPSVELHCARESLYKALSPGTGLPFRPEQWRLQRSGSKGCWAVSVPESFPAHRLRLAPRLVTAFAPPLQAALTLAHRAA
ncbi:hypothetical protein ACFPFX_34625 [Streptomyces mauvecolor]|uniref:4'-phosphopantetheinyl transferase N-terminal domain-containing protein n=1 Tax=Streptomyces mauvecolor TaxID=58345 RepID=A0ABV9UYD6_9ACTN